MGSDYEAVPCECSLTAVDRECPAHGHAALASWRRRALVAEALLGCADEVRKALVRQRKWRRQNWGTPRYYSITAPSDNEGFGLLATNPAELMWLVPATRAIIESALAARGLTLENLEDAHD